MKIGGAAARLILDRFTWADMTGDYYFGKSKLETCLGAGVWTRLAGKRVIDFGCGDGAEVVEIAGRGVACEVTGLDINRDLLRRARERAGQAGLADRCRFTDQIPNGSADVILSLDAFEHFQQPAEILRAMWDLLAPGGCVLISFGPPWYHPWGSHCLVFPWAHVVLTEAAIMEWRERFKHDGAKRYGDGSGGTNQMTVARFEGLLAASGFRVQQLTLIPIRKLGWAHNRFTREFTTACVRAELVKE